MINRKHRKREMLETDMSDKIRCSKLDGFFSCPSYIEDIDSPYDPHSPDAHTGTVNHLALSFVPRGEDPPLEEIAERHGLDTGDLERMVYYGRQAWRELSPSFPNPSTEHPVESDVCKGTADVVSVCGNSLAVADWKTGFSSNEHPRQVQGYAYCLREMHGTDKPVLAVEIWLRHRSMRVHKFSPASLDGFRDAVISQRREVGKKFGPGTHCGFCRSINRCKARAEYLRGTCEALAPIGETGLTRERLGELYDKAKAVRSALAQFDKLLDVELDRGPIPLGDGRTLQRVPYEVDEIDPLKAWPIVFGGPHPLTPEEATEVIAIGKGALIAAVKAQAPKGKGAAYEREVMQALRDAGAINKIQRVKKTTVAA